MLLMSDAAPEVVFLLGLFRAECNTSSDGSTHSNLETSANAQVLPPDVDIAHVNNELN